MHQPDPETIRRELQKAADKQHDVFLGMCFDPNCTETLDHGEQVMITAHYDQHEQEWRIWDIYCKHHDPHEIRQDVSNLDDAALATAIFNFPTDIPHNPDPHLSDIRVVDHIPALPALPDGNNGVSRPTGSLDDSLHFD